VDSDLWELVRRHSRRPGYRLVTWREVGLPFWRVPVRCLLMRRKPLSPVEEFVLRSVDADLRMTDDIAGLLGLPTEFVRNVCTDLVVNGALALSSSGGEEEWVTLTVKGRASLLELGEITPVEETLRINYDGLVRSWTDVQGLPQMRPAQARDRGLLEIPPFPSDPPSPGPGDTDQIATLLRQSELGRHDFDLIKVLGIDGRRETFYVQGIALVFQAEQGRGSEIGFLVDGRPAPDVEAAFSAAEGQRKLGILDSLREVDPAFESIIPDLIRAQAAPSREVDAMRQTTDSIRGQIERLEAQRSLVDDPTEIDQLIEAEEVRLQHAQSTLRDHGVRMIEVYEHPAFLDEALQTTTERLLIMSPWIRDGVVSDDFLRRLEALLEHDVEVVVAYGIGQDRQGTQQNDHRALRELTDLARRHSSFTFVDVGNTHSKVLVVDHSFAVSGSFNWLSFKGDPTRPFRDERSFCVTLPEVVDDVWERCLQFIRETTVDQS
jgi:hypothetical protein